MSSFPLSPHWQPLQGLLLQLPQVCSTSTYHLGPRKYQLFQSVLYVHSISRALFSILQEKITQHVMARWGHCVIAHNFCGLVIPQMGHVMVLPWCVPAFSCTVARVTSRVVGPSVSAESEPVHAVTLHVVVCICSEHISVRAVDHTFPWSRE